MIVQKDDIKQIKMFEYIASIIAVAIKPTGNITVSSSENNTVVIKDYNQKYLYTVVVFDLGINYNLVINNANVNTIIKMEVYG